MSDDIFSERVIPNLPKSYEGVRIEYEEIGSLSKIEMNLINWHDSVSVRG